METKYDYTTREVLVEMMIWAMKSNKAKVGGEILNCTDASVFSHKELFQRVAEYYHMEFEQADPTQKQPINICEFIQSENSKASWLELREKFHLENAPEFPKDVSSWELFSLIISIEYDIYSSMDKAAALGFEKKSNSLDTMIKYFDQMVAKSMIPI